MIEMQNVKATSGFGYNANKVTADEGKKKKKKNLIRPISRKSMTEFLFDIKDPETGERKTPKSFKQYATRKFDKWCLQGKGNRFVKAIYYFCFMLLVILYAKNRVEETPYKYYLAKSISAILEDSDFPLQDVRREEDFYNFLDGPLSSLTKECNNNTSSQCFASVSNNLFVVDDFVFKQLVVKPVARSSDGSGNSKCYIPPILKDTLEPHINSCYLDYSEAEVDTNTWINDTIVPDEIAHCYELYNQGSINVSFTAMFHISYGNTGYRICTADILGNDLKRKAKLMKQYNYIKDGTRVVYIDFTLVSTSLEAFAHVKLSFEFLVSADVLPYARIDVFSVSGISKNGFTKTFPLLIILQIVVAIYLFSIISNFYGTGCKVKQFCCQFQVHYNLFCIASYLLVFVIEYRLISLKSNLIGQKDSVLKNFLIVDIAYYENLNSSALSVCCILSVFHVIEFLKFSKRFSIIMLTIKRAFAESMYTFFTIILVIVGYSLAFYIAFGDKMNDFRNFRTSVLTCVASLFVEVDLREELMQSSRYLGPVLLLTYMFFVSFVVLSLFIAIIEGSFDAVKKEIQKDDVDPLYEAFLFQFDKRKNELTKMIQKPKKSIQKVRDTVRDNFQNRSRHNTAGGIGGDANILWEENPTFETSLDKKSFDRKNLQNL